MAPSQSVDVQKVITASPTTIAGLSFVNFAIVISVSLVAIFSVLACCYLKREKMNLKSDIQVFVEKAQSEKNLDSHLKFEMDMTDVYRNVAE